MVGENISVDYKTLTPSLKSKLHELIPTKDGKRKFCRTDLMKIMAWSYRLGLLESGDEISKIVMDESLTTREDVAAKISIYYSEELLKMRTLAARQFSELSTLCTAMDQIAKTSKAELSDNKSPDNYALQS